MRSLVRWAKALVSLARDREVVRALNSRPGVSLVGQVRTYLEIAREIVKRDRERERDVALAAEANRILRRAGIRHPFE